MKQLKLNESLPLYVYTHLEFIYSKTTKLAGNTSNKGTNKKNRTGLLGFSSCTIDLFSVSLMLEFNFVMKFATACNMIASFCSS